MSLESSLRDSGQALHAPRSWELGTYPDVSRALLDSRLGVHGEVSGDAHAHRDVRASVHMSHAPQNVSPWHEPLRAHARALVDALPNDTAVDLFTHVAEPWSLEVAHIVTGATRADAPEMCALARQLFLAAACATDGAPLESAKDATSALAGMLARGACARESIANVQSFVALTQSLPALLTGAWLELIRNQDALDALIKEPTLVATSAGELLRLGSPARVVFREALDDVVIGDANIARGDRVALNLWTANRDPLRYPTPLCLELRRETPGLVTFGLGSHRCPGSALVRATMVMLTEILLARCSAMVPAGDEATSVDWVGGFAILAPAKLQVVLSGRP